MKRVRQTNYPQFPCEYYTLPNVNKTKSPRRKMNLSVDVTRNISALSGIIPASQKPCMLSLYFAMSNHYSDLISPDLWPILGTVNKNLHKKNSPDMLQKLAYQKGTTRCLWHRFLKYFPSTKILNIIFANFSKLSIER